MSGIEFAPSIHHFTLCVRDLDKSTRFYVDTFGFEATLRKKAAGDFGKLMGVAVFEVELVMLRLGDWRLELVEHHGTPAHERIESPTNTVGYTHVAFYVTDVSAAAAVIEANGGTIDRDTWTSTSVNGESREYLFTRDPDGNRIELIKGSVLG
jgi:catechol 2,3-dioxygenase-like lactoylglutathione lyase family enzyme